MKHHFVLFTVISTLLVSCGKEEPKQTDLVTFDVRGKVVSIDTTGRFIMISHEEIPNYMMAMTMPFKIKDTTFLYKVEPGDSIQGTLAVSRTESWLASMSVTSKGEPPRVLRAGDIEMKRLFRVGEVFPDETLTNQDGRRIKFSDFRGKALAVTFIYTRCPIPDFCIRMSDYFAKVQRLLKQEPAIANKWHLLTISFDPQFDTPKVLKSYGENYGADFKHWTFAVEKMETILRIADGLDLTMQDDEGLIAHNLRTIIIGPDGKLTNIIKGNEWTPEEVATEMKRLLN